MRSQRRSGPKAPLALQIAGLRVDDGHSPQPSSGHSHSSHSHSHSHAQPLTPASPHSGIDRRASHEFTSFRSELQNILHINELISSNVPADRLLQRVIDACHHLLSVELMSLWMQKFERRSLICIASRRAGRLNGNNETIIGRSVPDDRGIMNCILSSGEPVMLNDGVSEDWRFCPETDGRDNFNVRSLLSVPVRSSDGRIVAILEAVNSTREHGFTSQDQMFLKSMAANTSSILKKQEIANELAVRQRRDQAQQLIASLLSSASHDVSQSQAIEMIEEIGQRVTGAKMVNLWLMDKDNVLSCAKLNAKVRIGDGVIGLAALRSEGEFVCFLNEEQQFCLAGPVKTSVGGSLAVLECIDKSGNSEISLSPSQPAVRQLREEPATEPAPMTARSSVEDVSRVLQTFNIADSGSLFGSSRPDDYYSSQRVHRNSNCFTVSVSHRGIHVHGNVDQFPLEGLSPSRCFSRDDVFLLYCLSVQAAVVLRNSLLHDETRFRARQTHSLLHIIELMSSDSIASHLIVKRIIDAAYKLLNCERITLFMVQEKPELIQEEKESQPVAVLPAEGEVDKLDRNPATMARLTRMRSRAGKVLRDDEPKAAEEERSAGRELVCVVSKDQSMRGIKVDIGQGIVGTCALTQKSINLPDAYDDHRFNKESDKKTNFRTKSLLTVPVLDPTGDVMAVIQACNRKEDRHNKGSDYFSAEDVQILESLSNSAGIMFTKARMLNATMQAEKKSRALLDLLKVVSSDERVPLHEVLDGIVNVTYDVIDCDRVTMYFVEDKELFSIVSRDVTGVRFPVGQGIAGASAKLGIGINVRDAHRDKRFDPSFDHRTGYRTQSVLCMPILDHDGRKVLAVIQLLNKRPNPHDIRHGISELVAAQDPATPTAIDASVSSSSLPAPPSAEEFVSFTRDDESILKAICEQISDCIRKHMNEALQIHYASNPNVTSLVSLYMGNSDMRCQTPIPPSPNFRPSRFQSTANSAIPSRLHSAAHTRKSSADSSISLLALPPSLAQPEQPSRARTTGSFAHRRNLSNTPTISLDNLTPQEVESQKLGVYDRRKVSVSFHQIFQSLNNPQQLQSPSLSRVQSPPKTAGTDISPNRFRRTSVADSSSSSSGHGPSSRASPPKPVEPAALEDVDKFYELFDWTVEGSEPTHQGLVFDDENQSLRQKPLFRPANLTSFSMSDFYSLPPSISPFNTSHLAELDNVNLDVFKYSFEELLFLTSSIFHFSGSLSVLNIPLLSFHRFLGSIGSDYTSSDRNAFHNFYHGVAALHFAFLMIRQANFTSFLDHLHVFAALIATFAHDVSHPGNSNEFEINTQSQLALISNDISVLERHHSYTFFMNLRKHNFISHWPLPERRLFRTLVIQNILATDMSVGHFPVIKRLSVVKDSSTFSFDSDLDQLFLGQIITHTADISGRVLPFFLCYEWESRIVKEFSAQAAREAQLGLPTIDFMKNLDQLHIRYQQQVDFLHFVLAPWFSSMARLFTGMQQFYEQLLKNQSKYEQLAKIEKDKFEAKQAEAEIITNP